MFDEMKFLTSTTSLIQQQYNKTVGGTVVPNPNDPIYSYQTTTDQNKQSVLHVRKLSDVKGNYIKSMVNQQYADGKFSNPYSGLLDYFDGVKTKKSLQLKASDFTYLRDIGVYPINRLMILRRFEEGVRVPVDLNNTNAQPIATIVGWIPSDEDFFSMNFHEVWRKQGAEDMLHNLLKKIVNDATGIQIDQILPIPGWGQGFVFNMLFNNGTQGGKENFANSLPLGDPNLLKESITREVEGAGLISNMTFKFETVYEQKYIQNVDITESFNDIMNNCFRMGTSNMSFLTKANSKLFQDLDAAANNSTSLDAWTQVITDIVDNFQKSIKEVVEATKKTFTDIAAKRPAPAPAQPSPPKESNSGTPADKKPDTFADKAKKQATAQGAATDQLDLVNNDVVKTILAATVSRYRWPLKGSIAMATGQAVTPWHLTVGNPYAPILSVNNIVVEDLTIKGGKELAYNDLPKTITVTIDIKPGRNQGRQELMQMFNIKYRRIYNPEVK